MSLSTDTVSLTSEHFAVIGRPAAGGAILTLVGELDIATAQQLSSCAAGMTARNRVRLVMDLRDLTFLDCAGLTALLRIHRLATAEGGWVRLARVRPQLERLIRIAGLSRMLVCYPEIGDAFSGRLPSPSNSVSRGTSPG